MLHDALATVDASILTGGFPFPNSLRHNQNH
ncbi:hypothetical protein SAMN05216368_1185 [Cryobacterium flavum]|uniref:Uncharacterized protein n=1 Tax=Cryobacterium flavum TaxID=1424659 RepID=A0A5E9GZL1_9MICO|nr:hypothetical protein SAMN05216368_1185 [Cryobacterium flavum]